MTVKEQILAEVAKSERPFCTTFSKIDGFPGCCDSCHYEEDEYGYSLSTHYFDDGKEADVCCKVGLWLDSVLAEEAHE